MKKLLPLLLVILFACQKDINDTLPTPPSGSFLPEPTPVTGKITGTVLDENGVAMGGVQVKVAQTVLTTDQYGIFSSGNLLLDKYLTSVKVEVPGYYAAYRNFSANEATNYLTIKLIKKTIAGQFTSANGGTITLSNGSSINILSNAMVVKSSGVQYSGNVNVYASYIDPTSDELSQTLPGSLLGINAGRIFALSSTGMLAVELESDAGIPLQLAQGKPAVIKMAIPSSLQSLAPSTIDTWSLNESGVWIKEATAMRNSSFYEFQASHFSFWNCDVPTEAIYLTLDVRNQSGVALPNATIKLKSTTTFGSRYGTTNSAGIVSGLVPKGEQLGCYIINYQNGSSCGIDSTLIGPYNANTSQTVNFTLNSQDTYVLRGVLQDCQSAAVTNGSVRIYANNIVTVVPVTNGNFTYSFLGCGVQIAHLIGIDSTTTASTPYSTVTMLPGDTTNTIITACNNNPNPSDSQFIRYTINNNPTVEISDTLGSTFECRAIGGQTKIGGVSSMLQRQISFTAYTTSVGSSAADSLRLNFSDVNVFTGSSDISFYSQVVGGFVIGTFSFSYSTSGTTTQNFVSGSFRLKRQ